MNNFHLQKILFVFAKMLRLLNLVFTGMNLGLLHTMKMCYAYYYEKKQLTSECLHA